MADVGVFQTQLTMAALQSGDAPAGRQVMNIQHTNQTDSETVTEHILRMWDLHSAHGGYALSFVQFTETYYRVNKLEKMSKCSQRFKM